MPEVEDPPQNVGEPRQSNASWTGKNSEKHSNPRHMRIDCLGSHYDKAHQGTGLLMQAL